MLVTKNLPCSHHLNESLSIPRQAWPAIEPWEQHNQMQGTEVRALESADVYDVDQERTTRAQGSLPSTAIQVHDSASFRDRNPAAASKFPG